MRKDTRLPLFCSASNGSLLEPGNEAKQSPRSRSPQFSYVQKHEDCAGMDLYDNVLCYCVLDPVVALETIMTSYFKVSWGEGNSQCPPGGSVLVASLISQIQV